MFLFELLAHNTQEHGLLHTAHTRAMGWIYLLQCLPTGKCYVGQTINDVRKRFSSHKSSKCSKGYHLRRAIDKYGWDNFRKETLVEVPNTDLDWYEVHFVQMYDAFGSHGLNSTPGGDFKPMLVPENRQRRIDKMKEPEVRENWLSAITTAQQKPEQRELLSKLCTERCQDPEHMKKRKEGQDRFLESLTDEERKDVIQRMKTPQAQEKRLKSFHSTIAERRQTDWKPNWDPEVRARRDANFKATMARKREARLSSGTTTSAICESDDSEVSDSGLWWKRGLGS